MSHMPEFLTKSAVPSESKTRQVKIIQTISHGTRNGNPGVDVREFNLASPNDRKDLIRFISWAAHAGKDITITTNLKG